MTMHSLIASCWQVAICNAINYDIFAPVVDLQLGIRSIPQQSNPLYRVDSSASTIADTSHINKLFILAMAHSFSAAQYVRFVGNTMQ